jgi:plasmid stability protein
MLIRGLNARVVKRLQARAKRHGRSLQGEIRRVLEQAAGADPEEVAALFAGWKKRFAGRRFVGSARLIREDRQR